MVLKSGRVDPDTMIAAIALMAKEINSNTKKPRKAVWPFP